MNDSRHTWALVLAAGEGSRLRQLTTTAEGLAVPKQFCSLQGGPSLLHEAIARAQSVTPLARICTVVAQQHRRWWEGAACELPPENIIVQPENRGTANGILLPLLHILGRDPDARIILLPSDHYVRDEFVLSGALREAVRRLSELKREILLLGLESDEVDPELGYIVPGEADGYGVRIVRRFVEKPCAAAARRLILQGALWNVFIAAAHGEALLALFRQRYPRIVADMAAAAANDAAHAAQPIAAAHLYRTLPSIDFSGDVLQGAEASLRVIAAPACGWADLGTPERVARTLRHAQTKEESADEPGDLLSGPLNLARQHSLLHTAI